MRRSLGGQGGHAGAIQRRPVSHDAQLAAASPGSGIGAPGGAGAAAVGSVAVGAATAGAVAAIGSVVSVSGSGAPAAESPGGIVSTCLPTVATAPGRGVIDGEE